MTKARDLAGFASSSVTTTASDGLVLKGDGSSTDVVIKNGANATVATVADGATGVTFAGTPTFPDGSINIADLDIDGGTDIGAALVDADLMIVDDGAGGTNRKATMTRLATYMGTKIGGGTAFISKTVISNAATVSFTGFDASKYDSYIFVLSSIVPATNNAFFRCRLSVDGGSNYLSASDSYKTGSGNDPYISVFTGGASNTTGNGCNFIMGLNRPDLNNRTAVHMSALTAINGDGNVRTLSEQGGSGRGVTNANTVVNGIQYLFSSGNITSGSIAMYGRVNS